MGRIAKTLKDALIENAIETNDTECLDRYFPCIEEDWSGERPLSVDFQLEYIISIILVCWASTAIHLIFKFPFSEIYIALSFSILILLIFESEEIKKELG